MTRAKLLRDINYALNHIQYGEEKEKEVKKAFKKLKEDLKLLKILQKENQELKEKYKKRAELSKELCDGLKQYEKVLDFLIGKFKFELKEGKLYFLYNNQYFEIDKENELMLKSVLGDE